MSYPNNPETVVIKNSFYPSGLTEIDIWNYYQKVKTQILNETKNKDIMFFINIDVNKPIIKRKVEGSFIHLTPKNYDTLITGRTVSIHSAMGMYSDFGIIDVDVDKSDGFKWALDATKNIYSFTMDKIPIIKTASIRFTGKGSFHIKVDFGRNLKTDAIRYLLDKFFRESELSRVYSVNEKKARPGVPNIDLNRNCKNCNYVTLNALSILGLRCMEVPYNQLLSFNPMKARIK